LRGAVRWTANRANSAILTVLLREIPASQEHWREVALDGIDLRDA
jgi:hypothetical protein